jgi:hypothetical protein
VTGIRSNAQSNYERGRQWAAVALRCLPLHDRREEIDGMRWSEIDLSKGMLSLPKERPL